MARIAFYMTMRKISLFSLPMRTSLQITLAASFLVHLVVGWAVYSHFSQQAPPKTLPEPVLTISVATTEPILTPKPSLAVASKPLPFTPAATAMLAQPPLPAAVLQPRDFTPHPPVVIANTKPTAPAISIPKPSGHSIVFLLDVSGSMYEETEEGMTRNTAARRILNDLVNALPDREKFTIVYYAESAVVASPLLQATCSGKEEAGRYVAQEVSCGGATNFPAGLLAACELHPSRIVVLTDGDLNMGYSDIVQNCESAVTHGLPAITFLGIHPRIAHSDQELLEQLADRLDGSYVDLTSDFNAPHFLESVGVPAR